MAETAQCCSWGAIMSSGKPSCRSSWGRWCRYTALMHTHTSQVYM